MTQFNYKIANAKNRALVCYVYGSDEDYSTEARAIMRTSIKNVLEAQELAENGDVYTNEIETPRTVAINLSSGAWARSLKIGNCSGDLIVGVYFYNQPDPPEPEIVFVPTDELGNSIGEPEYSEPEPAPSITSLVCDALQEAFPNGKVGASSFVISPELIDFELDVE